MSVGAAGQNKQTEQMSVCFMVKICLHFVIHAI